MTRLKASTDHEDLPLQMSHDNSVVCVLIREASYTVAMVQARWRPGQAAAGEAQAHRKIHSTHSSRNRESSLNLLLAGSGSKLLFSLMELPLYMKSRSLLCSAIRLLFRLSLSLCI